VRPASSSLAIAARVSRFDPPAARRRLHSLLSNPFRSLAVAPWPFECVLIQVVKYSEARGHNREQANAGLFAQKEEDSARDVAVRRDADARGHVRLTGRTSDEAKLGERRGALRPTARARKLNSSGAERTDETGLDMTASQMVLVSLRSVKAETATSGVVMLMLFVERSMRALGRSARIELRRTHASGPSTRGMERSR